MMTKNGFFREVLENTWSNNDRTIAKSGNQQIKMLHFYLKKFEGRGEFYQTKVDRNFRNDSFYKTFIISVLSWRSATSSSVYGLYARYTSSSESATAQCVGTKPTQRRTILRGLSNFSDSQCKCQFLLSQSHYPMVFQVLPLDISSNPEMELLGVDVLLLLLRHHQQHLLVKNSRWYDLNQKTNTDLFKCHFPFQMRLDWWSPQRYHLSVLNFVLLQIFLPVTNCCSHCCCCSCFSPG